MRFFKTNEISHQSEDCLFIPSALINSNRYRGIGSEAIILYTHLLDKSGLVHHAGPEPVTLYLSDIDVDGLCRNTMTKAFKQLSDTGLIFEKRQGRGLPNLIFIGKIKRD